MWLFLLFTVEIPLFLHVKEAACQCVWATRPLGRVAHTLPEANYSPVFRPQNSYRRFFGLWQPRKNRLSVKFSPYATFGGRSHTSRSGLPSCFPYQNSYLRFFDLGQPRKKPPFRQVFPLCYFQGRPRFSSGVAPLNFPKQITPCVFR